MSGYFWNDSYFENQAEYEELRELMNSCLDQLVGKTREYAIYRFGLDGQKEHSLSETAEYFSISARRVRSLDCHILRTMSIRMPTPPSQRLRLKEFLGE